MSLEFSSQQYKPPTVHPPVLHPAMIKIYGQWCGTLLTQQSRDAHRCWLGPVILNASGHHHCAVLYLPQTPLCFSPTGFRLFSLIDRSIFCSSSSLAYEASSETLKFITLAISPAVTCTCDCWHVQNVLGLPIHFPVVRNFSCMDSSCHLHGLPQVSL